MASVERFVRPDILETSEHFSPATFDVVLCYGGTLIYVCEKRREGTAQLIQAAKPGGVILVSVMSRYDASLSHAQAPHLSILKDPKSWHLHQVLESGDFAGYPSRAVEMLHPSMHLYTSEEIQAFFRSQACEILEVLGSNVALIEGSQSLRDIEEHEDTWDTIVELESRLNREPGLVDRGSHIIVASRRLAA